MPFLGRDGYPRLHIRDGGDRHVGVHTLVLETFVGPCPAGMECRHLDGVKTNNRLENLVWGTRQENEADKERHGRVLRGSQQPGSKLTEADVLEIRHRSQVTVQRVLAREYGVSETVISMVVNRKRWRHVT